MSDLRTLVLALATSAALAACGTSSDAAPEPHRVAIQVGASGYDPAEVEATAGEPLTLVFTRTTEEGCGGTLVIPSQNVRRDLPLNEPVEVTFTPAAGRLRFTCGMDMYDGAIVVQ